MIRHVVLFRFADTVTPADIESLVETLRTLPSMIPEIRRYECGPDVTGDAGNFDFAATAEFDDVAGYEAYRDHEGHREMIATRIRPLITERAAIQVGW
jgi:hypothetical protein